MKAKNPPHRSTKKLALQIQLEFAPIELWEQQREPAIGADHGPRLLIRPHQLRAPCELFLAQIIRSPPAEQM
jgi:hypothetical protein